MKFHWIIIILTFFTSCVNSVDESKRNTEDLDTKVIYQFPTVIDTIDLKLLDFLKNDQTNSTWLSTAEFKFLYIGPQIDTIFIDHFLSYTPPPPPPSSTPNMKTKDYDIPEYRNRFDDYYIDWLSDRDFKNYSDAEIKIMVDTSFITNNSYPVIIENNDIDTIQVGFGNYLPMILEALDSDKKWRPIQERFIYMCGNGVGTIILPPKEIVLSSSPIFNGNFNTKLRLTVPKTDIYSNTFNGNINYRQFESMFNEAGEYKTEYKTENKR